jgi:uncharacterized membrane protein AbrB (regulator of aidB expression)
MVESGAMRRLVPSVLLAVALVLDLLLIRSQVDLAIGAAACLERANFELVSCVAPPSDLLMILLSALAIGVAILLGTTIARSWSSSQVGTSPGSARS